MTKPDSAVFHKAARCIRDGGLTKGSFDNAEGEHCVLGALGYPEQKHTAEAQLLAEMIGIHPVPCVCGCGVISASFDATVTRWNDAEERTAEEVITLLVQAAEKAEAEL